MSTNRGMGRNICGEQSHPQSPIGDLGDIAGDGNGLCQGGCIPTLGLGAMVVLILQHAKNF